MTLGLLVLIVYVVSLMESPTTSSFVTRRYGTPALKVDFAWFSVHAPRAESVTLWATITR